jgi:hypothetical protein
MRFHLSPIRDALMEYSSPKAGEVNDATGPRFLNRDAAFGMSLPGRGMIVTYQLQSRKVTDRERGCCSTFVWSTRF